MWVCGDGSGGGGPVGRNQEPDSVLRNGPLCSESTASGGGGGGGVMIIILR